MKYLILLVTILFSINSLAASKAAIKDLSSQYFLQQISASNSLAQKSVDDFGSCDERPDSKPCIDYACSKVYCGSEDRALKVARACAGNYGDECIKTACNKVYCGSEEVLLKVINTCKYNYGSECINYACSKVYCGSEDRLLKVIGSCKGSDVGCVESLCSKVYCGSEERLLSVINTCAGRE
ncbi:MAG: hypothetical protein KDD37_06610 [Bdellovibrionales bacterium]|nr:hypothetical protein [Bdellovibrionales bacterium]